jgi:pimeloyl-ACP methyl ester carboxylesterase
VAFSLTVNARGVLQLALETMQSWRASGSDTAWNARSDKDAILLLHGLGGTPRMLQPLEIYLRRELERPTLDLALGIGLGDIRDLAIQVHRELAHRGVRNCDVIGYSMGGLVAAYLAKCLDQGRCIRRVITLGTPHRGVPFLTDWRGLLARWCRSADQMRVGSAFLDQLLRIPPPAGTSILSIAGGEDSIVPADAAYLDGAGYRNLVVPGIDHWSLLTSRRVFHCVSEVLQPARGPWAPPRLERVEPTFARHELQASRQLTPLRDARKEIA